MKSTMRLVTLFRTTLLLAAVSAAACTTGDHDSSPEEPSASLGAPGTGEGLQYGAPVPVGDGRARTYVVYDEKQNGAPVEIGVD